MALKSQDFDQSTTYRESSSRGKGVSNFLSGVAVVLSTLALLFSGFTAYQVFTLQQTLNANKGIGGVNQTSLNQAPNPTNAGDTTVPDSPPAGNTPAPNTTDQASSGSAEV